MKKTIFVFFLILLSRFTNLSAAGAPFINYQARLTDKKTAKPLEGSYALTFKIYDTKTSTVNLWQETQTNVIQNGVFNVLLGSVAPLNIALDKPYFLEISIRGEIITPRQAITSVGYAMRAQTAENVIQAKSVDTAKTAQSLIKPIVPAGAIIMRKSACPSGYKRVSELDGKFLTAGETFKPLAGGENFKTLSLVNLAAHRHSIVHSHNVKIKNSSESGDKSAARLNYSIFSNSMEDFTKEYTGDSGSSGSGQPFDCRPEFATVVLCEKE